MLWAPTELYPNSLPVMPDSLVGRRILIFVSAVTLQCRIIELFEWRAGQDESENRYVIAAPM